MPDIQETGHIIIHIITVRVHTNEKHYLQFLQDFGYMYVLCRSVYDDNFAEFVETYWKAQRH